MKALICIVFLLSFLMAKASEVVDIIDNPDCYPCYSAGHEYSCGISANWGGCFYMCCDGSWKSCMSKDTCEVQFCPKCISGIEYSKTKDGRLYSEFLSIAQYNYFTRKYHAGQVVHSSNVKVGDLIVWPGDEFNLTNEVVLAVQHHEVTESKSKCCIGLEIGIPECELKLCCGNGCCC